MKKKEQKTYTFSEYYQECDMCFDARPDRCHEHGGELIWRGDDHPSLTAAERNRGGLV